MARHPNGSQARRRARNRTYTVLALLVVVVVIAFIYGPFGADAEDENIALENGYQANSDTDLDASDANETLEVEKPQLNDTVAIAPQPEIVAPEPEPEIIVQEIIAPETSAPETAPKPEPGATVEPNPEADTLIAQAAALIGQGSGSFVEARENLNQAMRMPMSPKQREYVKAQLSELSNSWLFGRTALPNDPLCENYRVRPGDIFELIGKQHKVPYEILMDINRISNPRSLQAGQAIKIVKGPFHAKVYRSTFTMDVYLQNTYVRSFSVGLGKPGYETPTGIWRLRPGGKAYATQWRDPDTGKLYQPEDPDYPLGSRWMALDGLSGEAEGREGFGIHGTKEPDQIGTAGSRGCIRMYNGEAIKVYNMLVDGLSQVEVTD
ncbi:MAG: L,D-transpeptidase family protein [Planctomycetota bacterium]|nr:L,D-transpeptidase family protein [Planctomycetota bacterium]